MRSKILPVLLVAVVLLAAGCGASSQVAARSQDDRIDIAYTGWPEDAAIVGVTGALLEDLGYEVRVHRVGQSEAIDGVASGRYDVFGDVWVPVHEELLDRAGEGRENPLDGRLDELDLLNSWVVGVTRSSLAVPSYVGINRVDEIEGSGVKRALVLAPGASALGPLPEEALSRWGLEVEEYGSAAAMLEEVGRLYSRREPFVFLAWAPHWMNREYEITYLEDPGYALGSLTLPAEIRIITRRGMEEQQPLAHALIDTIVLTQSQVEDVQLAIREAGGPEEGARRWLAANRDLRSTWLRNAGARAVGS
ncbi:hypothetical protein RxyAA322_17680 [Rubrobacter xylanophilus]|uniref:ABC-type glycine betaine transport system substrate-binding domain-containing protein n=1 Tax=Rubrobacter xylanophilus TaxID=49319 RepID=A0A510HJ19_9ACTN|nr:glycine betaine ABC transporter substrate-binding protein [Rubrobacter xylanophilus]BBL79914.1 hypothetical protein RxyAA322_17680 [Rubrobacter xylanophilus]